MQGCVLPVRELRTHRVRGIRDLLRPLTGRPGGLACEQQAQMGNVMFGAFDRPAGRSGHVRDWRFWMPLDGFSGNYLERWMPTDASATDYYLERAYLTVYRLERYGTRREDEIVALHCDPNEPDGQQHARYKRGPHLHVSSAPDPIPHAHLALSLLSLDEVLGSIDELERALGSGVALVRDEVLGAYERR